MIQLKLTHKVVIRPAILLLLLLPLHHTPTFGQQKLTREEYINTFSELAMREMSRVGIPASITLAQGCLESNNGNSTLATRGNNHFGIKCHEWEGKKIYHDDDKRNECFRSYASAYESYKDHSHFLTSKQRYASLFELTPHDYRGWAKGLKKTGYATANNYATLLIRIIEENDLYRYDLFVLEGDLDEYLDSASTSAGQIFQTDRSILLNNNIEYVE